MTPVCATSRTGSPPSGSSVARSWRSLVTTDRSGAARSGPPRRWSRLGVASHTRAATELFGHPRPGTRAARPGRDKMNACTENATPSTSPTATFNFLDSGSNDSDGPANPGVYDVRIVQGPYDQLCIVNQNPAALTDTCIGCLTIFASTPPRVDAVAPGGVPQGGEANLTYQGNGFTRGMRIDMLLNGVVDTKITPNIVPFNAFKDPNSPSDNQACAAGTLDSTSSTASTVHASR